MGDHPLLHPTEQTLSDSSLGNHGLPLCRVRRIDESVGMPITDGGRRTAVDVIGSACREAAHLNKMMQQTRRAGR